MLSWFLNFHFQPTGLLLCFLHFLHITSHSHHASKVQPLYQSAKVEVHLCNVWPCILEGWFQKVNSSWNQWWFSLHTQTSFCDRDSEVNYYPHRLPPLLFFSSLSLCLSSPPCIPHMTFTFLLLFSQVLGLMDCPCISFPASLHSAP